MYKILTMYNVSKLWIKYFALENLATLSYFISNVLCLHCLFSVDIQNKFFDMGSALVFLQHRSILWFQFKSAIGFLKILYYCSRNTDFSIFDHLRIWCEYWNCSAPGESEDIKKHINVFCFEIILCASRVSISCTDLTSLRIALYNWQNGLFCRDVPSNRPSLAHNE